MIFAIGLMLAAMAGKDTAVIIDSGSTNTAGFRIVVERSGKAVCTGRRSASETRKVPKELLRRFYVDLEKPLAELPKHACMKSASFGTTLTIEFGGQTSPDLSCGDHGDERLKTLIADMHEIVKLFDER